MTKRSAYPLLIATILLYQLYISFEKTIPFIVSDSALAAWDYNNVARVATQQEMMDYNIETNGTRSSVDDITTRSNITIHDSLNVSNFYHCGYDPRDKFGKIFPEHVGLLKNSTELTLDNIHLAKSQDDILLFGLGGNCFELQDYNQHISILENQFRGKVIYFNGEVFGGERWLAGKPPKNQFQFGYVKDDCQSTRLYFLSQSFMMQDDIVPKGFYKSPEETISSFYFDETKKPRSNGDKFLLYVNSNCIDFREQAFDDIAMAVKNKSSSIVEYGGKCFGKNKQIPNKKNRSMRKTVWKQNFRQMREYRFCLVMENTKADGYITEKIMEAFSGGCIPIYYGTEEIFDVFNPNAFIYYNISNPKPALDKIKFLEENKSAYNDMAIEPILLDRENTIDKYFLMDHQLTPNGMRQFRQKALNMLHGGGC